MATTFTPVAGGTDFNLCQVLVVAQKRWIICFTSAAVRQIFYFGPSLKQLRRKLVNLAPAQLPLVYFQSGSSLWQVTGFPMPKRFLLHP